MLYRATTGTIEERTALDDGSADDDPHDDSASLLYDQPYEDENSYDPQSLSSRPGRMRTTVFQRRRTTLSSLVSSSRTTTSTTPTTPLLVFPAKTTTTPSMANNASVEVIIGRKTKNREKSTVEPSKKLASLFSSWRVPLFSSKQQQQELRAALSRPNVTRLSAAIENRHVIVDNEENDGTEEVVYDASHDGNPISRMYESYQENDNTKENVHNPMTIRTTAEAIELQTHPPRQESNCTHLASTTVGTTYQVIENLNHTEIVIEDSSTEKRTTTHIPEEEDGDWVIRSLAKLEDADSVGRSTTTTTVDCVDPREVVRGEGSLSPISTITGQDPEENHEVSVEEYSLTTMMVSTKFHEAKGDDGSFIHHEDRRRVQFVECAAIDKDRHQQRHPLVAAPPKGLHGDDDPSPTCPTDDTPNNNEHSENRTSSRIIRSSALTNQYPRQKSANTDGTTQHGVAFKRKTVPRVGQHRGMGKNTQPPHETPHLQPNKRTRR